MSALANRDFVKMNGLGNEIVIVDMRRAPSPISAARSARGGAPRALRPAHGALSAGRRAPTPSSASTTTTARRPAPAATACAASPRWSVPKPARRCWTFETTAGLIPCWRAEGGLFTVDMGGPRLRWNEIPLLHDVPDTRAIELQIGPIDEPILHSPSVVSMGNPHAIFWVDDPQAYDLAQHRPAARAPSDLSRARQHHARRDRRRAITS